MTVDDLAGLFVEEPSDEAISEFRSAFSLDLRTGAFTGDPAAQRWAWLVAGMDPRGGALAMAASETENLPLNGLQVQLVLARLTVDLWLDDAAAAQPNVIASRITRPKPRPLGDQAAYPCTYTPLESSIVGAAEAGMTIVMRQVMSYVARATGGKTTGIKIASSVAAILKFIAPYLLLAIDIELSQPPLVRTKSTASDGERRQLAARLHFDTGNVQLINCFRLAFAAAGLTFRVPADGPLRNANVGWVARDGFERVRFYGDPVNIRTDQGGVAIIGVEGIRQKRELAPTAGRLNTKASGFLTYSVHETSLGRDLASAAISATSPLKIALGSLLRAEWSSASFEFPVVDWGERWQTEIVIEERTGTGSIYFQWTGIMGVDNDGIVVGDGHGIVSIIGKLCVDIPPDGHSQVVDWRIDGQHTFDFDGYKEGDVLNLLLKNTSQSFKQTGDPGPCSVDAAFKQASAVTTLVVLGQSPIKLRANQGTQSIPFGTGTTLTIRMEPVSD